MGLEEEEGDGGARWACTEARRVAGVDFEDMGGAAQLEYEAAEGEEEEDEPDQAVPAGPLQRVPPPANERNCHS